MIVSTIKIRFRKRVSKFMIPIALVTVISSVKVRNMTADCSKHFKLLNVYTKRSMERSVTFTKSKSKSSRLS